MTNQLRGSTSGNVKCADGATEHQTQITHVFLGNASTPMWWGMNTLAQDVWHVIIGLRTRTTTSLESARRMSNQSVFKEQLALANTHALRQYRALTTQLQALRRNCAMVQILHLIEMMTMNQQWRSRSPRQKVMRHNVGRRRKPLLIQLVVIILPPTQQQRHQAAYDAQAYPLVRGIL